MKAIVKYILDEFYSSIGKLTLFSLAFRCVKHSNRASHHRRITFRGLEWGHFRQSTHEKDSVRLLLDGSHKPRLEANARNSASVS